MQCSLLGVAVRGVAAGADAAGELVDGAGAAVPVVSAGWQRSRSAVVPRTARAACIPRFPLRTLPPEPRLTPVPVVTRPLHTMLPQAAGS